MNAQRVIDPHPLPYCRPCRDAMAHGEYGLPGIPAHIRAVKPDACHPCVCCGERRFTPYGYAYEPRHDDSGNPCACADCVAA